MIKIPDTDNLKELEEFKNELHRALYDVIVKIQKLKSPPDLGIHVSEGLGVKMEQGK